MHRIILLAALLATPLQAGGPVIIEDTPVVRDHKSKLPLILLGLAVAAVIIGGGDTCNSEEPTDGGKC